MNHAGRITVLVREPRGQVELDRAGRHRGRGVLHAVGAEVGDMTDPGPLGLVEEPAHQAGEVDAEDGRDEVQTRGPAQRLLPRGLVVPVEAGVGPGPGGGPDADLVRGQPLRDPRAGLAGRSEDENLVSISAVHAFMMARKSESFNDLDAHFFA
jgi:hypothetical protein